MTTSSEHDTICIAFTFVVAILGAVVGISYFISETSS